MTTNSYEKRDDGVVINNNIDEFRRYNDLRNRAIKERELINRIENLESEVTSLKKALNKIHSRLD